MRMDVERCIGESGGQLQPSDVRNRMAITVSSDRG